MTCLSSVSVKRMTFGFMTFFDSFTSSLLPSSKTIQHLLSGVYPLAVISLYSENGNTCVKSQSQPASAIMFAKLYINVCKTLVLVC